MQLALVQRGLAAVLHALRVVVTAGLTLLLLLRQLCLLSIGGRNRIGAKRQHAELTVTHAWAAHAAAILRKRTVLVEQAA